MKRRFETSNSSDDAARLGRVAVAGLAAAGLLLLMRGLRRRSSFKDKVVVITGGSRGLGLALARRFAAEGARLALIARSGDQLDKASRELSATGAAVLAIACDVREPDAVDDAVARVVAAFGGIDVLVNNAGIIQMVPLLHARLEDFDDSLATHFWGPLFMVRACAPYLIRQRRGCIINIASVGGRVPIPHMAPYVTGKFALVGFSETLRAELAPFGISVTTVTPFLMRTGSHRNVRVRGQHRKEAALFALSTATPLTAIDADRAASAIVRAAAAGRSHLAPGWPARLAEIASGVSPGLVSAVAQAAVKFVLPSPSRSSLGDEAVDSRDLAFPRLSRLFATRKAARFNQRVAADEQLKGVNP